MAEIRFARGKKENLNESALSDGKISFATDEKVLYIDYKEGDEVKRELVQTLTVNGHTVYSDVPSNAKFTDTVYTHPNSGVTAGTYKSVTVDKAGHVTNGSNPTTLAGYGITDAASKAQGNKADTAVQSVKIGSSSTEYKSGTNVVLPAYPTTLPASDVPAWAKAATKPTYTATEVGADPAGSADAALSSAKAYIDENVETLNNAIGSKVDKVSGKGLSTNDYTTTEKNKLSGIASGAEVNQNAFSNITIGSSTIAADTKTDTLTLAGSNITLTPDTANDKVTIGITKANVTAALGYTPSESDTTYNIATTDTDGLMSSEDKTKLNGIATGANKYTHPAYTAKSSGLYKITVDATGHVSAVSAVAKADITALGIPAQDTNTWTAFKGATTSAAGTAGYVPAPAAGAATRYFRSDGTWATPPNTTYNSATTSSAGLMSAADKTKLDGIATGANKYTLPTASSSTLGGVKTTSAVTSTTGLTPCPIISGVPYYKDTNTLSSFGITATAAELNKLDGVTATATEINYIDGVTSNIQTQLNGKASNTHDHNGTYPRYTTAASEPSGQSVGDHWLQTY